MVKADLYTFAWVLSSGHRQTDLFFLFLWSWVNIRCQARRSKLPKSYDKLKYRSMTVNLNLKHPIPIFVDCHACVYWNNVCGCNHKKHIPAIIEPFKLLFLSGVPDYFDRNKILSGYDLSHYQVPHCIKSFILFCLICVYSSQFSIIFWIMYLL